MRMNQYTSQFTQSTERRKNLSTNRFFSRLRSHRMTALLTLILCLCTSINTFAQSDNAQISGFVKDTAGAVIAGAKVVVKSETKSVERTAITNEQGYYVISNVPPDV